jgi:hypothetical protein
MFGDSDYEWWVIVRAANKPKMLELLRGRRGRRRQGAGGRDEPADRGRVTGLLKARLGDEANDLQP